MVGGADVCYHPVPAVLQGLKDMLSNPTIVEEKKKDLVKRLATDSGFSQYTLNFLNLLIDQVGAGCWSVGAA